MNVKIATAIAGSAALTATMLVVPAADAANEWGSPVVVAGNDIGENYQQVTMNGAGTELAFRRSGAENRVQVATRSGGTWGPATTVFSDAVAFPQRLRMANDADVLVWEGSGGSPEGILAVRKTGGVWSNTPEQVDPRTGDQLPGTVPTVSADGTVVSYLTQPDQFSNNRVYTSTWNGSAWVRSAAITDGTFAARAPAISQDGKTVIFVLQSANPNNQEGLFISTLQNGTWSTPELVSGTDDVMDSPGYSPAVSADGKVIAYRRDTSDDSVQAVRKVSGSWTTPVTISDTGTEDVQEFALSSDGSTIIYDYDPSGPAVERIFAATFTNGSWTAPVLVSDPDHRSDLTNTWTRIINENGTRFGYRRSNGTWAAEYVSGAWQLSPSLAYPNTDGSNALNISDSGSTLAWESQTPDPDYFPRVIATSDPNPGPVSAVTAEAGVQSARVTWVPGYEGTSPTTSYTVQAYRNGQPVTGKTCTLNAPFASPLACTVSGLTAGEKYTFVVTPANSNGAGNPSNPSNEVTPTAPAEEKPGKPVSVTATAGQQSATVTWKAGTPGTAPTTSYTVQAYRNGQPVEGKTCTVTEPFPDPLSCTVTGLEAGVSYTFTVTATNTVGTSAPSDASNAVTPTGTPQPSKKTKLVVKAEKKSRIPVDIRSALVRNAKTPGRITNVRAWCELRGNRLPARAAKRLCGIDITRNLQASAVTAQAKPAVRVTAKPTCSTKLRIYVVITAKETGKERAVWRDSWRVQKDPRVICRVKGTG